MKDGQMMFVLFMNDMPLRVYRALTKNQQANIIVEEREGLLRVAKQQHGSKPDSDRPDIVKAWESRIETYINTHYVHFHDIRFKVAKPAPRAKAKKDDKRIEAAMARDSLGDRG